MNKRTKADRSSSVQGVLEPKNLAADNIHLHRKSLEERLTAFLTKLNLPERPTVDDLKDIVWNDDDTKLSSRLAFILLEKVPKKDFQAGLDLIMEAFNYFPHSSLNGLSPREMVERSRSGNKREQDNGRDDYPLRYRYNFFEIFADRFPKEMRVVKRGYREWEFEHTAEIQALGIIVRQLNDMDEFIQDGAEEDPVLAHRMAEMIMVLEESVNKQP